MIGEEQMTAIRFTDGKVTGMKAGSMEDGLMSRPLFLHAT